MKKKNNQPICEINSLGTKRWYLNGQLHREDGPAVEHVNGHKEWYFYDKLHREDGPAVEYTDGSKGWYLFDKLHREDGPAVEYAEGYKSWYYHGEKIKCFSQKKFERLIKLKYLW